MAEHWYYSKRPLRLKNWDYRSQGTYYVDIGTYNGQNYFGKVVDGRVELSLEGQIAKACWEEIPQHHNHVYLGEFIVMPNHIYGIIELRYDKLIPLEELEQSASNAKEPAPGSDDASDVEASPSTAEKSHMAAIAPKKGSLSTIIRSYKAGVSREIRMKRPEFKWRPRFRDHIIRDPQDFQRQVDYIRSRPAEWGRPKNEWGWRN